MQWACGDATQGASLVTSYSNQPSDLRLQLVYTGVAFSPMPANPSTTGASSTQTAAPSGTSNSASPAALGKTAPGSSASSTPAPVAKSNTAAIAGGSVAAAAGVSLIAAFAFWFFRRKNRTAKKQRVTSFMAYVTLRLPLYKADVFNRRPRGGPPAPLNERSFNPQPFQPIRPDSPEDWVSPMTGHPANASSRSIFPENIQASYNPPNKSMFPGSSEMAYNAPSHRPLFPETDTAYHGAGGDIADLVNVDIDDASSTHSPRSLCHPFEGPTPGPTPNAPQNPSFEGLSLHTKSIPYENIHNAAAPAHSHEYSPPPPSQFPQFSPTHSPTNMTFPAHFGDDHPLNQLMDNDQGLPLMHSSEIDEFASNWHDAVVAQQVQEDLSHDAAVAQRLQDSLARATRIHDLEQSRDTHIHDGQMPNTATATGLGVASAVPLRKAVPVRQASVAAAGGQGRVHDREARSEALRDMGRSENVRMEGWSPRRLQTVRAYAESVASGRSTPSDGESIRNVGSGGSSLRNVSMRDVGGDIREIEIPAKSPLRADHGRGPNPERLSFGLNHAISNAVGMSADGSRQKYQLVDDVLGERDVVPDIIPPVQNPSRKGPTGRRISELE